MRDRDSNLPLIICLGLSALTHFVAAPILAFALLAPRGVSSLDDAGPLAVVTPPPPAEERADESDEPDEPEDAPVPPEVLELGRIDEVERQTVAWISHDAFEKMMARQTETIQPALQQQADPVPDAPARIDAANPRAVASAASSPQTDFTPLAPSQIAPRPSTSTATPLNADDRMTAQSPLDEKALAKVQDPAKGPIERDEPPIEQAAATGPDDPNGKPVEQLAARTDAEPTADAKPTEQDDTGLPLTDQTPRTGDAVAMKDAPDTIAPQPRDKAEADIEQDAPPADQEEGETDKPEKGDKPTEQELAEADKPDPKGEPTEKDEAKADKPNPDGRLAMARAKQSDARSSREPNPAPSTKQSSDQPRQADQPAAAPSTASDSNDEPRPTSADRDERESPATQLEASIGNLRNGWVEVSQGLEVKTVIPRLSVIERMTSIPKDATFVLTFDKKGRVENVRKKTTTGDSRVDSAIISAAYQWTAKGEQLDESEGPVDLTITFKR